jgi:hypothetical protein
VYEGCSGEGGSECKGVSEVIEEGRPKCRETVVTAGAGARPRFMHDRQLGTASDHVEAGSFIEV